jgi:hypothetical protein
MMSSRLIVIALLATGSAGGARAAEAGGNRLDQCIETARSADTTCSKLTEDPTQRLRCFNQARDAQLDCLEHALAETPTGTAAAEDRSGKPQPDQPAGTASNAAPSQATPSKENSQPNSQDASQANGRKASQENADTQGKNDARSSSFEQPSGSISPKEPAGATQANRETVPSPAPSPEPPSVTTPPKEPVAAAPAPPEAVASPAPSPEPRSITTPAKEPAAAAQAAPEASPSPAPSATPAPAAATAAVQPETPKPSAQRAKAVESRWVVSETMSPVDYRPFVTAVIRPTSSSPGGPVSLSVRCWGGQTEILIRTEGTWHATRRNALPVDFQINDQSTARQTWTLSADARIATYGNDPIELLRSLPDGARLSVSVLDGTNAHQQATFLLSGWDAIRKRVEAACKWPAATEQASSGKR